MAGGPIQGYPQKAIEPHISAANAAGIFAEGSRFGVYVVGPCIGHGGMARIYRAEHEGLRRQVALKVLTDGFAHDSEGRRRFLREARIAAAIKHPNVVNIFDVGVQDGIPYLVMELLEGEDLESLLHSKGALDEASIIDLIVPVVAGLAAVHDAGVVHRDLKPGNIFLSSGRNDEIEPKLLDFGISKASGKDHMKLTSATKGLLMGTPFYMSPEAIQGADMTPLSDQYSLGVLLYESATGVNPFSSDTFAETVRRITTGEYPPLSEHQSRPSKRLVKIIERAMSLNPADRFADMRALGRELLMLAGQRTRITWSLSFGDVIAPARAELPTLSAQEQAQSSPQNPRSSVSARRWTLAAVLLGAVAFTGAAVLFYRNISRTAVATAPPMEQAPVAERPPQDTATARRADDPDSPPGDSHRGESPRRERGHSDDSPSSETVATLALESAKVGDAARLRAARAAEEELAERRELEAAAEREAEEEAAAEAEARAQARKRAQAAKAAAARRRARTRRVARKGRRAAADQAPNDTETDTDSESTPPSKEVPAWAEGFGRSPSEGNSGSVVVGTNQAPILD